MKRREFLATTAGPRHKRRTNVTHRIDNPNRTLRLTQRICWSNRPSLFCISIMLGAIVAVSGTASGQRPSALSGEALFDDVIRYAGFGDHRAGTAPDRQTSEWLADELRESGYETELQSWLLRQFFLKESVLKVDGKWVECFPFWYPKATGAQPVTGVLAPMTKETGPGDLEGKIAFVDGNNLGVRVISAGVNSLAEQAAAAGAVGLVVVVRSPSLEVPAINARAPYHQEPCPIPAMIVGAKNEAELVAAAQAGTLASIRIEGRDDTNAKAYNVIGTIKRGPKWIVVTTPTSGWFQCAGERGPGVALFLGLARYAAEHEGEMSYMFIANSGHELDNAGAHASLDERAPGVNDVECWIHLGASIATRKWEAIEGGFKPLPEVQTNPETRTIGHIVGTPDLLPLLQRAFKEVPGPTPRSGGPVFGELRHFIDAGYRSFGFFGGHHYFHTRLDTPATTEPEFLEAVGSALARVISKLDAED